MNEKIIVRIKGGLGNQLFCYAAARRLAWFNNAELVIDDVTGFIRDHQHQRRYMLDFFHIPARKASSAERMEPFERYRRGIAKYFSRRKPFEKRSYIEQEGRDFDPRMLDLKVRGVIYLDGLWQSELYFKDIEQLIREDLQIEPPEDNMNQSVAQEIRNSNAVALHVRWFNEPNSKVENNNLSKEYYIRAIQKIKETINNPLFFCFSDDPDATRAKLALSEKQVIYVNHNQGEKHAYADLWLMAQCKYFIIANSTFSWWGAWLSKYDSKVVIAPDKGTWGVKELIPDEWIIL